MKINLTIILLTISIILFGQPYKVEKFIDYENVISELKKNPNYDNLKYKYDYTFILLLDSSEIKLIEKIRPETVKYFRDYAHGISFNNKTVGFKTEKQSIKEVLANKLNQKRMFECLHTENSPDINYLNFDFPIYIKGNKAIFEISGPTWHDTYFARLENYVLQINWLGGVIE